MKDIIMLQVVSSTETYITCRLAIAINDYLGDVRCFFTAVLHTFFVPGDDLFDLTLHLHPYGTVRYSIEVGAALEYRGVRLSGGRLACAAALPCFF
jgi:hypothetical protein